MSEHDKTCEDLVERCKHEAKQLAEFTATRRKVHWTHPSFVSFCVSVEDILSYGVKKKYHSFRSKVVTPSGRVLQDLGKTLPEAAAIYDKCFNADSAAKEDYTLVHVFSAAERKIVWIRAALIEGKLQAIVESITSNPMQYYTKQSVLCHRVYGEIFKYLIDGPCSIRYSRLKTSDISSGMPSPAEIVQRHNQVLSISSIKGNQDIGWSEGIGTEAAWEHVRSMYQSTSSTCLFGKNSISVQPAGFSQPLLGYLTLQQGGASVLLKWIPNSLLQDSTNAHISLWKTVMSVDIVTQTAHIHCHRSPGQSAELILIGYDGIALPPLLFPHQPSFFLFLECLENSLLPQGCLEPPLWYIKDKTSKAKLSASKKKSSNHKASKEPEGEGEWFEAIEVWNQVFRIRYGPRPQTEDDDLSDESEMIRATPPSIPPAPPHFNLTSYSGGGGFESSESDLSDSEDSDHAPTTPIMVTVEKPGALARGDWEKFQSKVSRQLLARYFYSWLSHCRHMSKIRSNVSHLVGTATLGSHTHSATASRLSKEDWEEFIHMEGRRDHRWSELVRQIYLGGVDHDIRKEVWPYLLGVFPVNSSREERAAILLHSTEHYNKVLGEWQQVETTKKEIELEALSGHRIGSDCSRENSPTLSFITTSPLLSPGTSQIFEESHDLSGDHQLGDVVHAVNGLSHDRPCSAEVQSRVEVVVSHAESHNHTPGEDETAHDATPHSPRHECAAGDQEAGEGDAKVDHLFPLDTEEAVMSSVKFDSLGKEFVKNLYNIDKDIPRCDRDYWYFQGEENLQKIRNVVCSFVWTHLSEGYSQGMCDLLSPLLVVLDNEPLAYMCYLRLMEVAIKLFPPNTFMNTRLANVQALLQVMESDFYQYLAERPMGDGLFYAYRWLLVSFKREFHYKDVFRLWETIWAARTSGLTFNFEEFFALAIMKQFKTAIMDAHLDPSDILNLFTDLAEKRAINLESTVRIAQETIHALQCDLTKK